VPLFAIWEALLFKEKKKERDLLESCYFRPLLYAIRIVGALKFVAAWCWS